MLRSIRSLIEYRDLLFMITWRDIRIKYKQSVMGFLWAIFMPIIIVAAGVVVKIAFSYVSKQPLQTDHIVTIAVKALPWAFFVSCLRFSSNSLISNPNLVTKIYFPRIIFPVSAVISQLFDFVIASSVLVVILTVLKVGVSVQLLWIPLLVLILLSLALGMGIFFSAANLFFRDVKYLVEVILTFAIFFTPVFYEVEMFEKWSTLLMVNPVAPILEGVRACIVLQQAPELAWIAYSGGLAVVMLVVSVWIFARMEPLFAESI
jgi:homopolymeric O-antigen transport system permease protein